MITPVLPHLERIFWPKGNRLDVWMVVDGARDRSVSSLLRSSRLTNACLYSGALAPEMARVAPYLVRLEYNDQDTEHLLAKAWGNSWGVFLKCAAPIDTLRRHLRRYLMVRTWKGDELVFRYYDPRVLRVYLPTCRTNEMEALLGGIECFWVEDKNPAKLLEFRVEFGRLERTEVTFGGPPPPPRRFAGARVPKLQFDTGLHTALTIRREQFDAFAREHKAKFEDWMLVHLRKHFPRQCAAAVTDAHLRETIRQGIEGASVYGLTGQRDVCKYIGLTVVFGRNLDKNQRYPWAGEILRRRAKPEAKIESLQRAAVRHLRRA